MKDASTWLTVAAMAALGLGVDLKAIRKVGLPVIVTVTASLAVLIALSVTLLHVLSIQYARRARSARASQRLLKEHE